VQDQNPNYERIRQQADQAYDRHDQNWKNLAQQLFQMKNPVNGEPYAIDFHGLRVREALYILELEIDSRSGRQQIIHAIVGQGEHSINHVPRIKPAVEEYCDKRGLRHELEHNKGRILIHLQPGQQIEMGGYGGQQQPQYQQPQGGYPGYQQQTPQQQQQESDGGCLTIILHFLKSLLSSNNSNNRR
jgi:hypothetical protein